MILTVISGIMQHNWGFRSSLCTSIWEAYPYTGKDGVCKFSAENVAVQVIDSVNITLVLTYLISPLDELGFSALLFIVVYFSDPKK